MYIHTYIYIHIYIFFKILPLWRDYRRFGDSPTHRQSKSPTFPPKSPTFPPKSPTFPPNSNVHYERQCFCQDIGPWDCRRSACNPAKRALYFRQRALYFYQTAMYMIKDFGGCFAGI